MRYLLVSTAAAIALAGAATLASAQAPDRDKDKGPAAQDKGPGAGSGQREPGRSEPRSEPRRGAEREPGRDQPRATQPREQQPPRSTQGPSDRDRPKSAAPPDKDRPKATEQREPGKDQRRSTEQQQPGRDKKATEQREPGKDQPKSTEQQRLDKDKKATQQREPGKDQPKSTEQQRPGKDQPRTTEGPDQKQGSRIQVSEEQRTSVRERLVKEQRVERINKSRINVSVNVGARIPRSVRVHALPVAIVSLAPAYRSYSYFVLEDETICIVDPRTYVIVDVIPAGVQRADRPGRTYLTLSAEDMSFIYRTVPKDRRANVRVRLALGAEVPRNVDLIDFPVEVVERVPDVRRYRFIVADNDVIIIDPSDHAVALIINE